jgi:antitoxin VapB
MNQLVQTRTFKSGNSVAVRLPKGFAVPAGTEVEMEKSGDSVTMRVLHGGDDARRQLRELLADLEAIGRPADGVQARPGFEAPDRAGG